MGDVFDFWFEYHKVIPKGFVRLQGKLAQMADSGIKVYFFKGNHDMWVDDYFTKEIGIEIISDELIIERGGKRFYLARATNLRNQISIQEPRRTKYLEPRNEKTSRSPASVRQSQLHSQRRIR